MDSRIKNIMGFLLISAFLVFVSFTKNEQGKRSVKSVFVSIDATKGDAFMDKDDVIDLVYSRYDTLLGKSFHSLCLNGIENLLKSQSSVKSAEVYVEQNGSVKLDVELRKVIARIKPDSTPGFYIDEEGFSMTWQTKYSPRVLTITGHLAKYNRYLKDTMVDEDIATHFKLVNDVYEFAKYVNKNSFWKAQIGQVYINKNGDAVLIPLIGNEEFVFGELTNYKDKFDKINRYYDEIAPKLGWNKYKEVNVKYDRQIVCK
ncbi:MAG: hypothetical protein CMD35_08460 [Flavobacteriales bacterium]|nr:hypothetical protein [Flavobacteriales bacterium]